MPEAPEGEYRVADLSALEDENLRTVRVASFDDLGDPGEVGAEDGEARPPGGVDGAVRVASFDGFAEGTRDRSRGRRAGSGGDDVATTRTRRTGPARKNAAGTGQREGMDPGPRPGPVPGTEDAGNGDRRTGRKGRRDGSARRGRRGGRTNGTGASADAPPATPAEQRSRAKEICLRLLTDRARTVQELRDAMVRKEIPEDVADGVLERFDEVGLVDDAAFAEQWVRSRHEYRGLGRRAIAVELRRKGVDAETAAEALTGIDDDAERGRARELVARRLRGLPIGSREERQSTARKLVGMLARKGYGPGVAYGVVKEEIAAAGADADELGDDPPDDPTDDR